MYVVERDEETGYKFGICNREYYIFFMGDWHKIESSNIDEAKKIYRKICFEDMIEQKRKKMEL